MINPNGVNEWIQGLYAAASIVPRSCTLLAQAPTSIIRICCLPIAMWVSGTITQQYDWISMGTIKMRGWASSLCYGKDNSLQQKLSWVNSVSDNFIHFLIGHGPTFHHRCIMPTRAASLKNTTGIEASVKTNFKSSLPVICICLGVNIGI